MLFNSSIFLFAFLPVVWGVFSLLAPRATLALGWLTLASLFFYGWWNPVYLLLLGLSAVVGFAIARAARRDRRFVPVGVAFHLGLIGWFKYAGFLSAQLEAVTGWPVAMAPVALPLAISFFTFQQIAFLVDCGRGDADEPRFLHYLLFVTFFPQLISGPIVHHRELIPQLERPVRVASVDLAVGLTFLAAGLFKKTVLADGMALHVNPLYEAVERGVPMGLAASWAAALGYTLQLYFDFSGYSDMAVGLARLFGIRLPLNFHSPLKSESIIEFWRRWHMTLSRFLRDYLYIPLGGNRRGGGRRWLNLLLTMVLGGLWHGASWTFVVWGGLHGAYLVANHGYRSLKRRAGWERLLPAALGRPLSRLATLAAVAAAFVVFRSDDGLVALHFLTGMAGVRGIGSRLPDATLVAWTLSGIAVAWLLPNTQQWMRRYDPGVDSYGHLQEAPPLPWLAWQPTWDWALFVVTLLVSSLFAMMIQGHVEFLYRFF